jgi:hypothetical protein
MGVSRPVGRVLISRVRDLGATPPIYPDLRMRSRQFSALRGVSRADVHPMCTGGHSSVHGVVKALSTGSIPVFASYLPP